MELHQMRYFRAIVEHGSFSKAAEALHITQPALSKSISKLEEEVGAALLDRSGGKVTPTPAGSVFLPYCHGVQNSVESALTAVQESVGLEKGHVTIAVSHGVMIKPLILRFLRENPEVELICHLMTQEEMVHALQEGSVDFVLSDVPVTGKDLCWQELHRGQLTAVLGLEDPLLNRQEIPLSLLRHHRFCIGHLRTGLYSTLFQLCNQAGFQPHIRYLGYDQDMAGMLLSLPGSVIISSSAIDATLAQAQPHQDPYPTVPISGTAGQSLIGSAYRVGHYQSKAALRFYALLAEHFRSIS